MNSVLSDIIKWFKTAKYTILGVFTVNVKKEDSLDINRFGMISNLSNIPSLCITDFPVSQGIKDYLYENTDGVYMLYVGDTAIHDFLQDNAYYFEEAEIEIIKSCAYLISFKSDTLNKEP